MADIHAYRDLAAALATRFTVLTAERRGRGLSPRPYDEGHEIARDVEDIDAISTATGARSIFGLSSGGIITLEAARTLRRVESAIVYEPPFYRTGVSREGIARLHTAIENSDLPSALVASLVTAETAPMLLRKAPRPVARALASVALAIDARRSGSAATLRDLLPAIRYDFHNVAEMDGRMRLYSTVDRPVLLLSGTKSPAFLREAVAKLTNVLPDVEHVELDGLGHDGPWNEGNPTLVARAVTNFLDPIS